MKRFLPRAVRRAGQGRRKLSTAKFYRLMKNQYGKPSPLVLRLVARREDVRRSTAAEALRKRSEV